MGALIIHVCWQGHEVQAARPESVRGAGGARVGRVCARRIHVISGSFEPLHNHLCEGPIAVGRGLEPLFAECGSRHIGSSFVP